MYNKGRPIIITSIQINPILLRPIAWPEGVAPTASLRLREGIFFSLFGSEIRSTLDSARCRSSDCSSAGDARAPPFARSRGGGPRRGSGAEQSRAGGHGHDARRAGAGQDAGGHGGRRGVRAAAPRGAVLLRRHQPQLHPQHHPGKHARVDPLILSPLSLSLASWIRGAGERCLRADPAADLARALLVSAGTGEESR